MMEKYALDDSLVWNSEKDNRYELYQTAKQNGYRIVTKEKREEALNNQELFDAYDRILDKGDYKRFIFDSEEGYGGAFGIDDKFKDCIKSCMGTDEEIVADIYKSSINTWTIAQLRAYCTLFSTINRERFCCENFKKGLTREEIEQLRGEKSKNAEKYSICLKKLDMEVKRRIPKDIYEIALYIWNGRQDTGNKTDAVEGMYECISYREYRGEADALLEKALIPAYMIYNIENKKGSMASKIASVDNILCNGVYLGENIFGNYENRKQRWIMINKAIDKMLKLKEDK